jgi:hypothetical protein
MAKRGTDLDHALDELYAVSPAEFTAKRDALAKSLKAAGDARSATEVKGRRKPTQVAYVLNQLARRHADDLAELVDVGRELVRAQRKALRGEAGTDLRDAIARQRTVVAALTSKTAALMKSLGVSPVGHLDEIAGALRAALVDPSVGAQLEEGRLDKVPEPASTFPGAAMATHLAVVEAPRAEPKPEKKSATAPKQTAKAKAAEKRRAAREARERAAGERRKRAAEERRERERAKLMAAASKASALAEERAKVADKAERDAERRAAHAKKLRGEAAALASEARRLTSEAERVGREDA